MMGGFIAVLLVKGVFAFIVPVVCALWLVARASGLSDATRTWPGVDGDCLMPVPARLVTWGYEAAYVSVTGRSFLEVYRSRQVPEGALTTGSPLVGTAYSAVWYTARVILGTRSPGACSPARSRSWHQERGWAGPWRT